MRKILLILALVLMIQLASSVANGVRINEIEANPEGSDSGREWIELYSQEEAILHGWTLLNADGDVIYLNISFSGYFVINLIGQWLDNTDESVTLLNSTNSSIDYSILFNDSISGGDNRTWSYCDGGWQFINGTRGSANNCPAISDNNQTNQTQNNTNSSNSTSPTANNSTNLTNQSIGASIVINDPGTIDSREEFDIEINFSNLGNYNYDLKIFVEDGEDLISESYDEKNSAWRSSFFYIEEFINGPGNKLKTITMRINEENADIGGQFTITARLRRSLSNSYVEASRIIDFEPERSRTELEVNITNSTKEKGQSHITGEVVYLNNGMDNGKDDSKDIKSGILYRSKNQIIKEYSIYLFAGLCILIIALLLIKNKRIK